MKWDRQSTDYSGIIGVMRRENQNLLLPLHAKKHFTAIGNSARGCPVYLGRDDNLPALWL